MCVALLFRPSTLHPSSFCERIVDPVSSFVVYIDFVFYYLLCDMFYKSFCRAGEDQSTRKEESLTKICFLRKKVVAIYDLRSLLFAWLCIMYQIAKSCRVPLSLLLPLSLSYTVYKSCKAEEVMEREENRERNRRERKDGSLLSFFSSRSRSCDGGERKREKE